MFVILWRQFSIASNHRLKINFRDVILSARIGELKPVVPPLPRHFSTSPSSSSPPRTFANDDGGNDDVIDVEIADYSRLDPDPRRQAHISRRQPEYAPDNRLLNVAIIGKTNAGKSALTNALVGAPVSPVSRKCHTTRKMTRAITVSDKSQLIFDDTPGLLTDNVKSRDVEPSLAADPELSIKQLADSAQLLLVIHDVSDKYSRNRLDSRVQFLLYKYRHVPSVLVLNKVDLLKNRSIILELIATLTNNRVNGQMLNRSVSDILINKQKNEEKLDKISNEHYKTIKGQQETICRKINMDDDNIIQKQLEFENKQANNNNNNNSLVDESSSSVANNETIGEIHSNLDQKIDTNRSTSTTTTTTCEGNESNQKIDNNNYNDHSQEKIDNNNNYAPPFDRSYWPSVDFDSLDNLCASNTPMHKIPRSQLKKCFLHESGWPKFRAVFTLSALTGSGVPNLKQFLMQMAKEHSWRYHSSVVSPSSTLDLVKENVRGKVMENVPFDLPYNLEYQILSWEVNEHDTLCILMEIICEHERFVTMITGGTDNWKLKKISKECSQDLSNLFARDVYVRFTVRPKKFRQSEPARWKKMNISPKENTIGHRN